MSYLSRTLMGAAVAASLLAPAAYAQQPQSQSQTQHSGDMKGMDMKDMDMKDMDMKPMMRKNSEKMMSMPTTGKPDVDFATMMREHHKAAIDMAQWQLDHGSDAKMKDMARKMIAEQKKEIGELDAFLAKSGGGQSTSMGAGSSK